MFLCLLAFAYAPLSTIVACTVLGLFSCASVVLVDGVMSASGSVAVRPTSCASMLASLFLHCCPFPVKSWLIRAEVLRYFSLVKAAMNKEDGSILVLDILGGHAAETSIKLRRTNEVTGTRSLLCQSRICTAARAWINLLVFVAGQAKMCISLSGQCTSAGICNLHQPASGPVRTQK